MLLNDYDNLMRGVSDAKLLGVESEGGGGGILICVLFFGVDYQIHLVF